MDIVDKIEKAINSDIINNAINDIAKKLGTTTEYFVTEFAKYNVYSNIVYAVVATIVLIISFTVSVKVSHRFKEIPNIEDEDSAPRILLFWIGIILSIAGFAVTCYSIWNVILWYNTPDIMTIKYIMDNYMNK